MASHGESGRADGERKDAASDLLNGQAGAYASELSNRGIAIVLTILAMTTHAGELEGLPAVR
jgi:hypothetical protein